MADYGKYLNDQEKSKILCTFDENQYGLISKQFMLEIINNSDFIGHIKDIDGA